MLLCANGEHPLFYSVTWQERDEPPHLSEELAVLVFVYNICALDPEFRCKVEHAHTCNTVTNLCCLPCNNSHTYTHCLLSNTQQHYVHMKEVRITDAYVPCSHSATCIRPWRREHRCDAS